MRVRRQSGGGRRLLVVAAAICLTINVATRYCFLTAPGVRVIRKVASHSPSGERQRLLADGLHWVAPGVHFRPLERQPTPPIAVSSFAAVTDGYFEECLYNRPPPVL